MIPKAHQPPTSLLQSLSIVLTEIEQNSFNTSVNTTPVFLWQDNYFNKALFQCTNNAKVFKKYKSEHRHI